MRTRTWLTTPPDQAPTTDAHGLDDERYVPGPGLPTEPRVPVRHRRALLAVAVLLVLMLIAGLLVIGEQAQREDPSIPDAEIPQIPGQQPDDAPELPES